MSGILLSSATSPKNLWHFFTKCRLRMLEEISYLGISNVHSRINICGSEHHAL